MLLEGFFDKALAALPPNLHDLVVKCDLALAGAWDGLSEVQRREAVALIDARNDRSNPELQEALLKWGWSDVQMDRERDRERADSKVQISRAAVDAVKTFTTARARAAADVSHVEDRAMKEQAIQWYFEHRQEYASKDEAAEAIAKVVPAKPGTIRRWLRNK